MIQNFVPYIAVFLTGLIQVLFFQYWEWGQGWLTPNFHLLGMLLLPLLASPTLIMLVCALSGLIIDYLAMGGGIFTSSSLIVGLVLPGFNRLLAPREGYEPTDAPTVTSLGVRWFVSRTFMVVLSHNVWLFAMEASRWSLLGIGWAKSLTSTLFSTVLFVAALQLVQSRKSKR
jgi:hypothetical protein